jgi:hypothetical protein
LLFTKHIESATLQIRNRQNPVFGANYTISKAVVRTGIFGLSVFDWEFTRIQYRLAENKVGMLFGHVVSSQSPMYVGDYFFNPKQEQYMIEYSFVVD